MQLIIVSQQRVAIGLVAAAGAARPVAAVAATCASRGLGLTSAPVGPGWPKKNPKGCGVPAGLREGPAMAQDCPWTEVTGAGAARATKDCPNTLFQATPKLPRRAPIVAKMAPQPLESPGAPENIK
eukprot:4069489-Pyramimonas_sp.AAC.1